MVVFLWGDHGSVSPRLSWFLEDGDKIAFFYGGDEMLQNSMGGGGHLPPGAPAQKYGLKFDI